MPRITLPDGKVLEFAQAVTGKQIAETIGPGLTKAIGVKLDGKDLRDLARPIDRKLHRDRDREGRRSGRLVPAAPLGGAHVLAGGGVRGVPRHPARLRPAGRRRLLLDLKTPRPVTEADFTTIEAKMQEIVAANRPFTRCDYSASEGLSRTANDKSQARQRRAGAAEGRQHAVVLHQRPARPGLGGSLRGPTRAVDRLAQGEQGDVEVAGAYWHQRPEQRPADPHLRHLLRGREGAEDAPHPARGGQAPQPSQARQGDEPLPRQGGQPGSGVLASRGMVDLYSDAAGLHAREAAPVRLRGRMPARPT